MARGLALIWAVGGDEILVCEEWDGVVMLLGWDCFVLALLGFSM